MIRGMLSVVLVFALTFQIVTCAPVDHMHKRIGQTLTAATTKWRAACESAGGGVICTTLSQAAAISLTSNAGPCDQQDTADTMINLAHNIGSPSDLITLAQIFVQQPRDTNDAYSAPYCQKAPKNGELQGLYQCQFRSSQSQMFAGGLKIGKKGTIPLGLVKAITPAGGCPAHPSGPITDGAQLADMTSSPGLQNIFKHRTASSVIPVLHKTAVSGAPRPTITL